MFPNPLDSLDAWQERQREKRRRERREDWTQRLWLGEELPDRIPSGLCDSRNRTWLPATPKAVVDFRRGTAHTAALPFSEAARAGLLAKLALLEEAVGYRAPDNRPGYVFLNAFEAAVAVGKTREATLLWNTADAERCQSFDRKTYSPLMFLAACASPELFQAVVPHTTRTDWVINALDNGASALSVLTRTRPELLIRLGNHLARSRHRPHPLGRRG